MLPRFHRILVPLDLTEKNRIALDYAFELAVLNHATVTLLHIIEPIPYDEDAEVREFLTSLARRSAADLETLAQRFAEAGLAVEWKTFVGKRAPEIVRYATDHHIDLIIMNSHRIDPEKTNMSHVGTLSHQVSIFCQCPVLLVK